jgi:poly-gamma-glutamate capsule biosynthesis protein CapA/YwtB (metallophosphatase superfamily)
MKPPVTLCAIGDVHVAHAKAGRERADDAFHACAHVFREADVNFFNCEVVYTDRSTNVLTQHPASRSTPEDFAAICAVGFDVASIANNHAMDYGPEGLLDTIDLCVSNGIAVVGAGKNLDDATAPAVIESKGTKIAFLAYNCVGPDEFTATPDRAGVAAVKILTVYEPIEYQPGTPCRVITVANPGDLDSMRQHIATASEQADVVIVNFHWGMHHVEAMVNMYQQELAYAALDAGAGMVLGGHDHVAKGIEVYKGKVIFYGLGDFVFDTPANPATTQTEWRRMKQRIYGLTYDFDYPTYPFPPESRNHLIVRCLIEDGHIARVSFLPCTINKIGQPQVLTVDDEEFDQVVRYLSAISAHQGFNIRFTRDGDEIVIGDAGEISATLGPAYTRFVIDPVGQEWRGTGD